MPISSVQYLGERRTLILNLRIEGHRAVIGDVLGGDLHRAAGLRSAGRSGSRSINAHRSTMPFQRAASNAPFKELVGGSGWRRNPDDCGAEREFGPVERSRVARVRQ